MILEAMVVIHVINTKGNPAFKMTWMLCVLVFPLIGATFYAMVQLQIGTRFLHDRLSMLRIETEPYMRQDQEIVENLWASKSANAHLSYYLSRQLGFPTYRNTEVQYFPLGEDKFKAMLLELKKARKFIFMEYFIVEKGYMWGSILEILKEKAMEGVEVRFMYARSPCCRIIIPASLKSGGSSARCPIRSNHSYLRRRITVITGRSV